MGVWDLLAGFIVGILGLLFFWMVVLKLLSRLFNALGVSGPCNASIAWIIDNPWRQKMTPGILDAVGIRRGERVLELGPGPGAFTVEATRRAGSNGRLTAVDIQPAMIAKVQAAGRSPSPSNSRIQISPSRRKRSAGQSSGFRRCARHGYSWCRTLIIKSVESAQPYGR